MQKKDENIKPLNIILRTTFVLFSLFFIRDAFDKWDGYSYYMHFSSFLPSLSLYFILWSLVALIFGISLWLVMYGLSIVTSRVLHSMNIRYFMLWFFAIVIFVCALEIKRSFLGHISTIELINYKHPVVLIPGVFIIITVVSILNKQSNKIVQAFNDRITPLVWLFGLILIAAVPLSMMKAGFYDPPSVAANDASADTGGDRSRVKQQMPLMSRKKSPNIILITMDTLAAKDMHVHGYKRQTTPFIDEWAKKAVVFNRAYASSNWTAPAVVSLMTGKRVWTHKIWHQTEYHPVRNYPDNVAGTLSEYGYDVYGFVQNLYAHPETIGIKKAFLVADKAYTLVIPRIWWFDKFADLFRSRPIVRRWIRENQLARYFSSYQPDRSQTRYPPELAYNRFLEEISSRRQRDDHHQGKPFFAWLHVMPPHEPYLPDETNIGYFGDGEEFNTRKKQYANPFYKQYDPDKQNRIDVLRKRYDEFILYSDKQFELFVQRLSEAVDMTNTIIILSSDHGENFAHGFLGHGGPHLYEPVVHIPLIIKMPGDHKGGQIDLPIEQIDIAPTILGLAGLPTPAWMEGRSLVSFLEFNRGTPYPVLSMALSKNRSFGEPITTGTIAVWEGDYKLIYYIKDNNFILFNVQTDPEENHDISDEKPEIAQRLLKIIHEKLSLANSNISNHIATGPLMSGRG